MQFSRIINSICIRLPQLVRLRSGIKVRTYGRVDNSLFLSVFTSEEYLCFVPSLIKHNIRPDQIIDCGAAYGFFTLLIQHLIKTGILDWHLTSSVLIEPNPKSLERLRKNLAENSFDYETVHGLVGKKTGTAKLQISKGHPWGSSIKKKASAGMKSIECPFVDLTTRLSKCKSVLKLDIEGGEFDFIDNYKSDLRSVVFLIIEFHLEFGDFDRATKTLKDQGFKLVAQHCPGENRVVAGFCPE